MKKKMCVGGWRDIIVEDYHLSFPFIYEEDGEIYIIPESSKANTLYRYQAVKFPDIWKRMDFIESVKVADTALFLKPYGNAVGYTLKHYENGENKAHLIKRNESGKIYLDESIFSDDYHTSRLGGAFVRIGKNIYKIAQDCSESYGKNLVVLKLIYNDEILSEKQERVINSDDIILDRKMVKNGVHTYNCSSKYEIIDIKTERTNIIDIFYHLKAKYVDHSDYV